MYEYAPTDSEGYFTQIAGAEYHDGNEQHSTTPRQFEIESQSSGDDDDEDARAMREGRLHSSTSSMYHAPHARFHRSASGTVTSAGSSGTIRDWNEEFQILMEKKDSEAKFAALSSLAKDFIYISELYGRMIISEIFVAEHEKSIKSTVGLGLAGGCKYIVKGIIFKLAVDAEISNGYFLYGRYSRNDEKAIKASKNELKGLCSFFHVRVKGIHLPLMALIQYRGFCLSAITLLPISSQTLLYGSSDAGKTIHTKDAQLNSLMAQIGSKLNLMGREVQGTQVFTPMDIEGHLGNDGRYYCIDFGRVLPPEKPIPAFHGKGILQTNAIFHNLFLQNFIQKYPTPLCSDALSNWLKDDPNRELINLNTTQAYLFEQLIPATAQDLEANFKVPTKDGRTQSSASLPVATTQSNGTGSNANGSTTASTTGGSSSVAFDQFAHERGSSGGEAAWLSELKKAGINCRHLGFFRKCLTSDYWRRVVLVECTARALKNGINATLRQTMQQLKISTLAPYLAATTDYLQPILYYQPPHPKSLDVYRRVTKEGRTYFQKYVDETELARLPRDQCTFVATRESHALQKLWICYTCRNTFFEKGSAKWRNTTLHFVVCEACTVRCHNGHNLVQVLTHGTKGFGFCDCSLNVECHAQKSNLACSGVAHGSTSIASSTANLTNSSVNISQSSSALSPDALKQPISPPFVATTTTTSNQGVTHVSATTATAKLGSPRVSLDASANDFVGGEPKPEPAAVSSVAFAPSHSPSSQSSLSLASPRAAADLANSSTLISVPSSSSSSQQAANHPVQTSVDLARVSHDVSHSSNSLNVDSRLSMEKTRSKTTTSSRTGLNQDNAKKENAVEKLRARDGKLKEKESSKGKLKEEKERAREKSKKPKSTSKEFKMEGEKPATKLREILQSRTKDASSSSSSDEKRLKKEKEKIERDREKVAKLNEKEKAKTERARLKALKKEKDNSSSSESAKKDKSDVAKESGESSTILKVSLKRDDSSSSSSTSSKSRRAKKERDKVEREELNEARIIAKEERAKMKDSKKHESSSSSSSSSKSSMKERKSREKAGESTSEGSRSTRTKLIERIAKLRDDSSTSSGGSKSSRSKREKKEKSKGEQGNDSGETSSETASRSGSSKSARASLRKKLRAGSSSSSSSFSFSGHSKSKKSKTKSKKERAKEIHMDNTCEVAKVEEKDHLLDLALEIDLSRDLSVSSLPPSVSSAKLKKEVPKHVQNNTFMNHPTLYLFSDNPFRYNANFFEISLFAFSEMTIGLSKTREVPPESEAISFQSNGLISINGSLIQSKAVNAGDTVGIFFDGRTRLFFFTANKMINGHLTKIPAGLYYIYIVLKAHNETRILANYGPARFLFPIIEFCHANGYGNVNSNVRYGGPDAKCPNRKIRKRSEKFWQVEAKAMIESYYHGCLSEAEKDPSYHLLFSGEANAIDFELLIARLAHLTRIKFSEKVMRFRNSSFDNKDVVLDDKDVLEMRPKIVHLDLIDYAEMMSRILATEKRFTKEEEEPLPGDVPRLVQLADDLVTHLQRSVSLSLYKYWLMINAFILQTISDSSARSKFISRVMKHSGEIETKLFPCYSVTTYFFNQGRAARMDGPSQPSGAQQQSTHTSTASAKDAQTRSTSNGNLNQQQQQHQQQQDSNANPANRKKKEIHTNFLIDFDMNDRAELKVAAYVYWLKGALVIDYLCEFMKHSKNFLSDNYEKYYNRAMLFFMKSLQFDRMRLHYSTVLGKKKSGHSLPAKEKEKAKDKEHHHHERDSRNQDDKHRSKKALPVPSDQSAAGSTASSAAKLVGKILLVRSLRKLAVKMHCALDLYQARDHVIHAKFIVSTLCSDWDETDVEVAAAKMQGASESQATTLPRDGALSQQGSRGSMHPSFANSAKMQQQPLNQSKSLTSQASQSSLSQNEIVASLQPSRPAQPIPTTKKEARHQSNSSLGTQSGLTTTTTESATSLSDSLSFQHFPNRALVDATQPELYALSFPSNLSLAERQEAATASNLSPRTNQQPSSLAENNTLDSNQSSNTARMGASEKQAKKKKRKEKEKTKAILAPSSLAMSAKGRGGQVISADSSLANVAQQQTKATNANTDANSSLVAGPSVTQLTPSLSNLSPVSSVLNLSNPLLSGSALQHSNSHNFNTSESVKSLPAPNASVTVTTFYEKQRQVLAHLPPMDIIDPLLDYITILFVFVGKMQKSNLKPADFERFVYINSKFYFDPLAWVEDSLMHVLGQNRNAVVLYFNQIFSTEMDVGTIVGILKVAAKNTLIYDALQAALAAIHALSCVTHLTRNQQKIIESLLKGFDPHLVLLFSALLDDKFQSQPTLIVSKEASPQLQAVYVRERFRDQVNVDEVAQFYVDCFDDDPLLKSLTHAPKTHVWYARKVVEHACAHGRLWDRISQGGSVMGYAFWLTPGAQSFALNATTLGTVLHSKKGKDVKRLVGLTEQCEALQRTLLGSKASPNSAAPLNGNFWTLLSVFVVKKHRRHGFGRSLLQPVLEKADATRTICFTWTTNEAALPFFFKLGFSMKEKFAGPNYSIFALLRSPQKVH